MLDELVDYIDWQFFFHAWDLKGKFPALLDHPAARELYDDARTLLDGIARDGLLQARGVYGFWPAHAESDDVVVGDDAVLVPAPAGDQRRRAAEPVARRLRRACGDHLGAFAVAVHGADELAAPFEAEHDDYQAIVAKALADRLAEAFAEWLHERVRREWYAPDEHLTSDELIGERYRGIRPALGYPACPDHSEKPKLFALLGADRARMTLTEGFAMLPAASVSGLYFAHPQSRYFAVGRIGRDQLADYAERRGVPVAEAERWLQPNLS